MTLASPYAGVANSLVMPLGGIASSVAVGTFTAMEANFGQLLSFALVGNGTGSSADNALFRVDSASGVLFPATNTTLAARSVPFLIRVAVSDNGTPVGSVASDFVIKINNAPTAIGFANNSTTTYSIDAAVTTVGVVVSDMGPGSARPLNAPSVVPGSSLRMPPGERTTGALPSTVATVSDTAAQPTILVVDDEEHITELLSMGLGMNGFDVVRAANGREALAKVPEVRPDLIVLDVMMPELDGFEVARRLRQVEGAGTQVPIIFLTARDTTADKVEGLRLGSDDYVTKPFSIEELVERVKAVLRRTSGVRAAGAKLVYADLELDEETRDVWRAGQPVDLTPTEYKLLHYLLSNPRRVLTRNQILEQVWDYTFEGNASVLETYISYLRQKVDVVDPPLIHTVRGVGYSLRLPRDATA